MATFTVDTAADEAFGGGNEAAERADGAGLSLREAVGLANAAAGADRIQISAAATEGFLRLVSGELEVTETLTVAGALNGQGLPRVTISGDAQGDDVTIGPSGITNERATPPAQLDDNSRIFRVTDPAATLTVEALTLTGGHAPQFGTFGPPGAYGSTGEGGGAIKADGDVFLISSVLRGNLATGSVAPGGALMALGDVDLTDSSVTRNLTDAPNSMGGGIYSAATVRLVRSDVTDNRTFGVGSDGGGIFADDATTLVDSVVSLNAVRGAGSDGGGISGFALRSVEDRQHRVLAIRSEISENGAREQGGGIDGYRVTLIDSEVRGNYTLANLGEGGGVRAAALDLEPRLVVIRSTIADNYTRGADAPGGGLSGDRVYVIDSTVTGNRTEGDGSDGGGIYARDALTLLNATIAGNSVLLAGEGIDPEAAGFGGGVGAGSEADVAIVNATITGNYARSGGGGANLPNDQAIRSPAGLLYAAMGSIRVANSIVAGNAVGEGAFGADIAGFDGAPSNELPLVLQGSVILGSAYGETTGFGPIEGEATILDGASLAALGSLFRTVGENPATGVLSGLPGPNGGPVETVALAGGAANPAIDTGLPGVGVGLSEATVLADVNGDGDQTDVFASLADIAFDARGEGFSRRVGPPDAGAFEAQGLQAIDDMAATTGFTPIFALDVLANDGGAAEIVELQGLTSGNSARTEGGRVFNNGDGTLSYAPRRDFTGTDRFDYVIEDGSGMRDTATVEIVVAPLDPDLEIARLVAYLFEAGLGREAAAEGLNFNADRVLIDGETEPALARGFLNSDEFEERAGAEAQDLTDRELVEQLFLNVLGRPGAEPGIQGFVDDLGNGLSREQLLITFAESPENLIGSPAIATIVELPDGSFDFA